MKAWAFYRRSTDKQELSISDQRRECRTFAASRGWEIVREFEPIKGWGSGLTIDRDPSFKEMVRVAVNGGHDCSYLIVYDASRFGRLRPEEKIYWEQHLKKNGGIQIMYVHEDFKNDGSLSDTLLKVVKHSEAHEFSRKLSEVTLRGQKSHAALGHSTGGNAPYGYDRLLVDDRGTEMKILKRGEWKSTKLERVMWKPSPTESLVLKEIFESYLAGKGLRTIADGLNARKVPAPRGRHWSNNQIHHLLRNRTYLGERIFNQRSYKGYRRGEKGSLFNPKEMWVIKINAHEPIISKELFDSVQALFPKWKERINGSNRKPYLLTGLAVCSHCGYRLYGTPRENGKGYRTLTYICGGYQRFGSSVCQGYYLRTEILEETAVRAIKDHLANPAWREELTAIVARLVQDQFGFGAEQKAGDYKRQLSAVDFEITNVVNVVKGGTFSPALAEALRGLETRKESIQKDLLDAEDRLGTHMTPQRMVSEVMAFADQFDAVWEKGNTPEERKGTIRQYIHKILVEPQREVMHAKVGLYKIPHINNLAGHPFGIPGLVSKQVNCGGTLLTNLETPPTDNSFLPEDSPFIVYQPYTLKGSYVAIPRLAAI